MQSPQPLLHLDDVQLEETTVLERQESRLRMRRESESQRAAQRQERSSAVEQRRREHEAAEKMRKQLRSLSPALTRNIFSETAVTASPHNASAKTTNNSSSGSKRNDVGDMAAHDQELSPTTGTAIARRKVDEENALNFMQCLREEQNPLAANFFETIPRFEAATAAFSQGGAKASSHGGNASGSTAIAAKTSSSSSSSVGASGCVFPRTREAILALLGPENENGNFPTTLLSPSLTTRLGVTVSNNVPETFLGRKQTAEDIEHASFRVKNEKRGGFFGQFASFRLREVRQRLLGVSKNAQHYKALLRQSGLTGENRNGDNDGENYDDDLDQEDEFDDDLDDEDEDEQIAASKLTSISQMSKERYARRVAQLTAHLPSKASATGTATTTNNNNNNNNNNNSGSLQKISLKNLPSGAQIDEFPPILRDSIRAAAIEVMQRHLGPRMKFLVTRQRRLQVMSQEVGFAGSSGNNTNQHHNNNSNFNNNNAFSSSTTSTLVARRSSQLVSPVSAAEHSPLLSPTVFAPSSTSSAAGKPFASLCRQHTLSQVHFIVLEALKRGCAPLQFLMSCTPSFSSPSSSPNSFSLAHGKRSSFALPKGGHHNSSGSPSLLSLFRHNSTSENAAAADSRFPMNLAFPTAADLTSGNSGALSSTAAAPTINSSFSPPFSPSTSFFANWTVDAVLTMLRDGFVQVIPEGTQLCYQSQPVTVTSTAGGRNDVVSVFVLLSGTIEASVQGVLPCANAANFAPAKNLERKQHSHLSQQQQQQQHHHHHHHQMQQATRQEAFAAYFKPKMECDAMAAIHNSNSDSNNNVPSEQQGQEHPANEAEAVPQHQARLSSQTQLAADAALGRSCAAGMPNVLCPTPVLSLRASPHSSESANSKKRSTVFRSTLHSITALGPFGLPATCSSTSALPFPVSLRTSSRCEIFMIPHHVVLEANARHGTHEKLGECAAVMSPGASQATNLHLMQSALASSASQSEAEHRLFATALHQFAFCYFSTCSSRSLQNICWLRENVSVETRNCIAAAFRPVLLSADKVPLFRSSLALMSSSPSSSSLAATALTSATTTGAKARMGRSPGHGGHSASNGGAGGGGGDPLAFFVVPLQGAQCCVHLQEHSHTAEPSVVTVEEITTDKAFRNKTSHAKLIKARAQNSAAAAASATSEKEREQKPTPQQVERTPRLMQQHLREAAGVRFGCERSYCFGLREVFVTAGRRLASASAFSQQQQQQQRQNANGMDDHDQHEDDNDPVVVGGAVAASSIIPSSSSTLSPIGDAAGSVSHPATIISIRDVTPIETLSQASPATSIVKGSSSSSSSLLSLSSSSPPPRVSGYVLAFVLSASDLALCMQHFLAQHPERCKEVSRLFGEADVKLIQYRTAVLSSSASTSSSSDATTMNDEGSGKTEKELEPAAIKSANNSSKQNASKSGESNDNKKSSKSKQRNVHDLLQLALEKFPLFGPLCVTLQRQDVLNVFALLFEFKRFREGEIILSKTEQAADRVVVLLKGQVTLGICGNHHTSSSSNSNNGGNEELPPSVLFLANSLERKSRPDSCWKPLTFAGVTCVLPHRWYRAAVAASNDVVTAEAHRSLFVPFLKDIRMLDAFKLMAEAVMCFPALASVSNWQVPDAVVCAVKCFGVQPSVFPILPAIDRAPITTTTTSAVSATTATTSEGAKLPDFGSKAEQMQRDLWDQHVQQQQQLQQQLKLRVTNKKKRPEPSEAPQLGDVLSFSHSIWNKTNNSDDKNTGKSLDAGFDNVEQQLLMSQSPSPSFSSASPPSPHVVVTRPQKTVSAEILLRSHGVLLPIKDFFLGSSLDPVQNREEQPLEKLRRLEREHYLRVLKSPSAMRNLAKGRTSFSSALSSSKTPQPRSSTSQKQQQDVDNEAAFQYAQQEQQHDADAPKGPYAQRPTRKLAIRLHELISTSSTTSSATSSATTSKSNTNTMTIASTHRNSSNSGGLWVRKRAPLNFQFK